MENTDILKCAFNHFKCVVLNMESYISSSKFNPWEKVRNLRQLSITPEYLASSKLMDLSLWNPPDVVVWWICCLFHKKKGDSFKQLVARHGRNSKV